MGERLVPAPFRIDMGGGLDTKSDPKQGAPGSFVSLQNVQTIENKRARKRNGYGPLWSTSNLPGGGTSVQAIKSYRGSPIAISINESAANCQKPGIYVGSACEYRGAIHTVPSVTLQDVGPTNGPSFILSPDTLSNGGGLDFAIAANGNRLFAYSSAYGYSATYWVTDSSGNILQADTLLVPSSGYTATMSTAGVSNVQNVKVILGNDGNFYVGCYVYNSGTTTYGLQIWCVSSSTLLETGTLINIVSGAYPWDWCTYNNSGTNTLVVAVSGASNLVSCYAVTLSTLATSAVLTLSAVSLGSPGSPCALAMAYDPGVSRPTLALYTIGVGGTYTGLSFLQLNASTLAVSAHTSTTVPGASAGVVLGRLGIVAIEQVSGPGNGIVYAIAETLNSYSGGVIGGNTVTAFLCQTTSGSFGSVSYNLPTYNTTLASKPVVGHDGNLYVVTQFLSNQQGCYFLQYVGLTGQSSFLTPLIPCARMLYTQGLNSIFQQKNSSLFQLILTGSSIDNDVLYWPMMKQCASDLFTGDFAFSQSWTAVMATAPLNGVWNDAECPDSLYLTGGFLSRFDGLSITEAAFLLYPEPPVLTTSNTGGSLADGVYGLCGIFEWYDVNGNVDWSAPSVSLDITCSGGNLSTITAVFTSLPTTLRQSAISPIVFGRSAPRLVIYITQANGDVYYRSHTALMSGKTTSITITGNNIVSGILYASGSVTSNLMPDAGQALFRNGERLAFSDQYDSKIFWYSKLPTEGQSISFAETNSLELFFSGGPITAIAAQDSNWLVSRERGWCYFSGDGVDNTGSNGSFSTPQEITQAIGALTQASICKTDSGIFFGSVNGIQLLDRSLMPHYIGSPVEYWTGNRTLGLSVLKSTLVTDGNNKQVRFIMNDLATCLVYDLDTNHWSGPWPIYASDACSINGLYTIASSGNNNIYQETVGAFIDKHLGGMSYVSIQVCLSWLPFGSLEGFKRVWWVIPLGDNISSHTLQVQLAFDYLNGFSNQTWAETHTITSSNATDGPSAYDPQLGPKTQKCKAIQIQISDLNPIGESLDLTGIDFILGVTSGVKMPESFTKRF